MVLEILPILAIAFAVGLLMGVGLGKNNEPRFDENIWNKKIADIVHPWDEDPKKIEQKKKFLATHKQVGYLYGKRVKKKDLPHAMKKDAFTWQWVKKKNV